MHLTNKIIQKNKRSIVREEKRYLYLCSLKTNNNEEYHSSILVLYFPFIFQWSFIVRSSDFMLRFWDVFDSFFFELQCNLTSAFLPLFVTFDHMTNAQIVGFVKLIYDDLMMSIEHFTYIQHIPVNQIRCITYYLIV